MGDINQHNVFGRNIVSKIKTIKIKNIINNHRAQGFFFGVLTSVVGSFVFKMFESY